MCVLCRDSNVELLEKKHCSELAMLRAINENSFNTFTMLLVKPRVSWFSTHNENKDVTKSAKKAHRGSGRTR
jgi:hypothetical protein